MKKQHIWGESAPEPEPETSSASSETSADPPSQSANGGPPVVTPFVAGLAAGASQVMSRYSYPKSPGDERWSIIDLAGPTSYTVITTGTPPTGGQAITAAAFGLMSIDTVITLGSNNGQYEVIAFPNPFNLGDAMAGVVLMWTVAATGAQVSAATNLSTFAVRLLAIGR